MPRKPKLVTLRVMMRREDFVHGSAFNCTRCPVARRIGSLLKKPFFARVGSATILISRPGAPRVVYETEAHKSVKKVVGYVDDLSRTFHADARLTKIRVTLPLSVLNKGAHRYIIHEPAAS